MNEEIGDASDMTNVAYSESGKSQISKIDSESLVSFKNDKLEFEKFIDNSFSGEFNRPFNENVSVLLPGKSSMILNKTYIESVNYDDSGKPIKKIYTSQAINSNDKDGNVFSEINSGYIDEEKGIKKALQQKLLNDKGFKTVKTRDYVNKEEREDRYLRGISENQVDAFFKNYEGYKNRCGHKEKRYLK